MKVIFKKFLKLKSCREIALQLRAPAAPAKDPGSTLRAHIAAHNHLYRDPMCCLASTQTRAHAWCSNIHSGKTFIHIK
jgi:hypothetical protein